MAELGTYFAKAYKQKEAAKEYSFAACPFGGQSAQWESRKDGPAHPDQVGSALLQWPSTVATAAPVTPI